MEMPKTDTPDPLRRLPGLISAADKYPEAILLVVGMVLLVDAFVTQIGPWQISGRSSVEETALIGGMLSAFAVGWRVLRRRSLSRRESRLVLRWPGRFRSDIPDVVFDHEFLLKLFLIGMPPAFVKEEGRQSKMEHVFGNNAFFRFQQPPDAAVVGEGRRKEIVADHEVGDLAALTQGWSCQVEVSDTLAGGHERVILTTKTKIPHLGKNYVVGWYVPVDVRQPLPDSEMCLEDEMDQVRYKLIVARPGQGLDVRVAESLRDKGGS